VGDGDRARDRQAEAGAAGASLPRANLSEITSRRSGGMPGPSLRTSKHTAPSPAVARAVTVAPGGEWRMALVS
jgi:hypothetical protein